MQVSKKSAPGLFFFLGTLLFFQGEISSCLAGEGNGCRIGFVDLKEVFNRFHRTRTHKREINRTREEETERIEKKKATLAELRTELKPLDPRSNLFFEKTMETRKLECEIELDEEFLNLRIDRMLKDATEEIYEEILKACRDYALENDLQAVFKAKAHDPHDDVFEEPDAPKTDVQVLFHAQENNITQEIIDRLNGKHEPLPPVKADTVPPPPKAEGQVIGFDENRNIFTVRLEDAAGLLPGQTLVVWAPLGESYVVKGTVRVVKIVDKACLCTMFELNDPENPIRKGDFIWK